MSEYEQKLSDSEVMRNVHGPMYQYEFDETDQGELDASFGMSLVNQLHCKETAIYRQEVSALYFGLITIVFYKWFR